MNYTLKTLAQAFEQLALPYMAVILRAEGGDYAEADVAEWSYEFGRVLASAWLYSLDETCGEDGLLLTLGLLPPNRHVPLSKWAFTIMPGGAEFAAVLLRAFADCIDVEVGLPWDFTLERHACGLGFVVRRRP